MQQLIELYEMVALNGAGLRGTEKLSILKAGLALRMFERAMQSFRAELSQAPAGIESFIDRLQCHPATASPAALPLRG
jgi:hypothetical protein